MRKQLDIFYNTAALHKGDYERAVQKATRQRDLILDLFKKYPDQGFTAPEVHSMIQELHRAPITSIRRAITNLYKDGHLEKMQQQRTGLHGVPNYLYRLCK